MSATHRYNVVCEWADQSGLGTASYTGYSRDHTIRVGGKPDIEGSADPAFRGDPTRHNPEELLLASISTCHMLWYLHLCADAGIVVLRYRDDAEAEMSEHPQGGAFTLATLRPVVTIKAGCSVEEAQKIHREAHKQCFIANSLSFPLAIDGKIEEAKV